MTNIPTTDNVDVENHLSDFTEWNPNPIIEMNLKGEVIYFNLAARAQFPNLISMGARHPIRAGLAEHIANLKYMHGQFVVFSREVSYFGYIYEQQIFSISEKNFIFVYMNDITARRNAENEQNRQLKINLELEKQNKLILEANRLKSEFLANMSHELRSPLNAVIGFSELMHSQDLGPTTDAQKDALKDILVSAKNLLRIINDLLDITNAEFEKIDFAPEEINVNVLVNEVIDNFQALTHEKQIHLTTTIDESIATIYLDPNRFKQVLYNYLSNALKFIPKNGSVHVRIICETDTHFRIEIEDDGGGISPDDVKKLFIPFQQLDSGMAKKYPGAGLGLSLTKYIVEAQGGKVGAICAPNKNIFYAILPREHKSNYKVKSE